MTRHVPIASFVIPVGGLSLDTTQLERLHHWPACSDVEFVIVLGQGACAQLVSEVETLGARSDTRIVHVGQSGPGPARNQGMASAAGDYVIFLDADDDARPEVYLTLCTKMSRADAEIGVVGYREVTVDGRQRGSAPKAPKAGIQSGWTLMRRRAGVWRFAFKRSFLEGMHLQFSNLDYGEDLLFLVSAFSEQPAVLGTPEVGYLYRHHGRGQLSAQEPSPEAVAAVWISLNDSMSERGLPSDALQVLESWIGRIWIRFQRMLSPVVDSPRERRRVARGILRTCLWTFESPADLAHIVLERLSAVSSKSKPVGKRP